jgi:hypothetical protein
MPGIFENEQRKNRPISPSLPGKVHILGERQVLPPARVAYLPDTALPHLPKISLPGKKNPPPPVKRTECRQEASLS